MTFTTPLPDYLAEPSQLGDEISITGKWVPSNPGGRFRTTEESREMLQEWEDIHQGARADVGVLSTEINHAVGEDAVLVHHVFRDAEALLHYFGTTAATHAEALLKVASPGLHLVRGNDVPPAVGDACGPGVAQKHFAIAAAPQSRAGFHGLGIPAGCVRRR